MAECVQPDSPPSEFSELPTRIWIVSDEVTFPELYHAAKSFGAPVITSNIESVDIDDTFDTVYVMDQFEGPLFTNLISRRRVLGPTALIEIAEHKGELLNNQHPIFSFAMMDLKVVFTGFNKEEQGKLRKLIRYMGGSVRYEVDPNKTTHLVANNVNSRKYSEAIIYGIPVMSEEWIHKCWEQRFNIIRATSPTLMGCTVPIFTGLKICCFGFNENQSHVLNNLITSNGGVTVAHDDDSLTHLIFNPEHPDKDLLKVHRTKKILKREWLWECIRADSFIINDLFSIEEEPVIEIQKGFLTPKYYSRMTPKKMSVSTEVKNLTDLSLECNADSNNVNVRVRMAGALTPNINYTNGTAFRRILNFGSEDLEALSKNDRVNKFMSSTHIASTADAQIIPPNFKDSASVEDLEDKASDQEDESADIGRNESSKSIATTDASSSSLKVSRTHVIEELHTTEKNYLRILQEILRVKEKSLDSTREGGPLLIKAEANIIFGNLKSLYDLHSKFLQKIDLIITDLSENVLIGKLLIEFCPMFKKEYPMFLNLFEKSQAMLTECMETKSGFRTLLESCRTDPNSTLYLEKASLRDFLIRPMQRMSSIPVIIKELLRRTDESHPDYKDLVLAFEDLKGVVESINGDKKNIESMCRVMDLYHLILNCPPSIVASSHTVIKEFEGIQLNRNGLSHIGDHLKFVVFHDIIEVVKVRSKVDILDGFASLQQILLATHCKPYKHVTTIALDTIVGVVDIEDCDGVKNAFSFQILKIGHTLQKSYALQLIGNKCDCLNFLFQLVTHNYPTVKKIPRRTAEEEGVRARGMTLRNPISRVRNFASKRKFQVSSALGLQKAASDAQFYELENERAFSLTRLKRNEKTEEKPKGS